MRVLCPWCLGREKTFTRIADLKVHCTSAHLSTTRNLPENFFTSATGFYLSVHATDYRRMVKHGLWNDEQCFEARKAVLRWVETQKDAKATAAKWRAGWVPAWTASEKATMTSKRPLVHCTSDIGEDPEINLEEPARKVVVKDKTAGERNENLEDETAKAIEVILLGEDTNRDNKVTESDENHVEEGEIVEEHTALLVGEEPDDGLSAGEGEATLPNEGAGLGHEQEKIQMGEEETVLDLSVKKDEGRILDTIKTPDGCDEEQEGMVERTIQERAERLLRTGAMPLCPPARRDWSKGGGLEIEVGGKNLEWPPVNWTTMTKDQRLLAFEFAAMTLEFISCQSSFPAIHRDMLLDKYNFLALPGTAKYRRDEPGKEMSKSRYYNYMVLRKIELAETTTEEDACIVQMLETATCSRKDKGIMFLVESIDKLKIPLRLELETEST